MEYRKPTTYIPPYNYCDRWCERCRIEKTRCLTYQAETDAELEAMSQGKETSGGPSLGESMRESLEDALSILEEAAREKGIDLASVDEAPGAPRREKKRHPLLERAMAFSQDVHRFLVTHRALLQGTAGEGEDSLARLTWYHSMVGPKIGRIVKKDGPLQEREDRDEEMAQYMEAGDILSAQVAHKALVETEKGLLWVIQQLPSLTDTVIDLLVQGKGLREIVAEEWLARENALLEPVGDGPWWGPLEDAEEGLEVLRKFRRKRKGPGAREVPDPGSVP
ncbi:MAG: hypothetical protein ACYTHM_01230 [Planctomycetota bacterium]